MKTEPLSSDVNPCGNYRYIIVWLKCLVVVDRFTDEDIRLLNFYFLTKSDIEIYLKRIQRFQVS